MSFEKEVDDNIASGLIKRIADDIIQGIEKVRDKATISRRRWIWELIQNAKDVPNKWGQVKIEVILENDRLKFSHNGDPFTVKNLTNLILQVSSKTDDEDGIDDITGKFGTGFLVTHLLSRKLSVNGFVKSKSNEIKEFSILIDRSCENSKDLIPKIYECLEEVKRFDGTSRSLDEFEEERGVNDFQTEFIFPLSEKSFISAKDGIDDLINTLPLTVVFNKKIKEVIIKDRTENIEKVYLIESKNLESEIIIHKITIQSKESGSVLPEELYFLSRTNENVKLSLRVVDEDIGSIIDFNKKTPLLYRDFPLIGTELFYSPFVIQSKFHPNEERSWILLKDEESIKVIYNRERIEEAFELAKSFIQFLSDKKILNEHMLAISKMPNDIPDIWFREVQANYREFLLQNLMVRTSKGRKPLREIRIPKYSNKHEHNNEFWNLCSDYLGSDIVPIRGQNNNWIDVINQDYEQWKTNLFFSLDDLVKELDSKEKLDDINITCDKYQWFNDLINFIENRGQRDLLSDNKIIPRYDNKLSKLDELWVGKNINQELYNILEKLNTYFKLLHNNIALPFEGHQSITNKNYSDKINEKIKEDDFLNFENHIEILFSILKIFPQSIGTFRHKILKLASRYYNLKYEIITIPEIQNEYDFGPAIKRLLNILILDISKHSTLKTLSQKFESDIEKTILWLDELFSTISGSSEYSYFLEEANIIPNVYHELKAYDEIYNNGQDGEELPEPLLIILTLFDTSKDWKKILLADGIGIRTPQTKTIQALTAEIETLAERAYLDISNPEYQYADFSSKRTALINLVDYISSNPEFAALHLKWTVKSKANIVLQTIDKVADRENVYSILKRPDLLSDFAKISNSGISSNDLSIIADIADEIGAEKLIQLGEIERERKRDFEFKKLIGENVESIFKNTFSEEGLPYDILHKGIGEYDYLVTNSENGKQYYIEIKSLASKDTPLKMAKSQGVFASERVGNYSLLVLIRPSNGITISLEYLKSNLICFNDIGKRLTNVVKETSAFISDYMDYERDILIEYENPIYAYRLNTNLLEKGERYGDTIEKIKSCLE